MEQVLFIIIIILITRIKSELSEGKDFLIITKKVIDNNNPPWSKMQKFLEHGMKISKNLVYLTTINHYTTKRRIRDMRYASFFLKEIYCVPTPKKRIFHS